MSKKDWGTCPNCKRPIPIPGACWLCNLVGGEGKRATT
jgi:hypothetical protein